MGSVFRILLSLLYFCCYCCFDVGGGGNDDDGGDYVYMIIVRCFFGRRIVQQPSMLDRATYLLCPTMDWSKPKTLKNSIILAPGFMTFSGKKWTVSKIPTKRSNLNLNGKKVQFGG